MADEIGLDGRRALDALLHEAEQISPGEVPALAGRAAAAVGIRQVTIYLADIQQDLLVPLPDETTPSQPVWRIDDSLAGWAYRTTSVRVTESAEHGLAVWLRMAPRPGTPTGRPRPVTRRHCAELHDHPVVRCGSSRRGTGFRSRRNS